MLVYSLVLGCIKMILFGWLIITAMLNREQTDSMNCLLLSGLCAIAAGLFCQEAAPVFEPVRFGWQTENAAFIFIILLAGGLWYDMVKSCLLYTSRADWDGHVPFQCFGAAHFRDGAFDGSV